MRKITELNKLFEEEEAKIPAGVNVLLEETEEEEALRYGIQYMMQRDSNFKLLMLAVAEEYSRTYKMDKAESLCMRIAAALALGMKEFTTKPENLNP